MEIVDVYKVMIIQKGAVKMSEIVNTKREAEQIKENLARFKHFQTEYYTLAAVRP
jgi:hypothetical protein